MTNIENRFYTTEHLDQLSQDAQDRHLDGTSYDVPVGFTMAFNGEIALDKAFDYIVDTLKIDLPESSRQSVTQFLKDYFPTVQVDLGGGVNAEGIVGAWQFSGEIAGYPLSYGEGTNSLFASVQIESPDGSAQNLSLDIPYVPFTVEGQSGVTMDGSDASVLALGFEAGGIGVMKRLPFSGQILYKDFNLRIS